MIRRHVYFSGKVQGVYFRYNTKKKAENEDVTGWVQNLEDGRVEAVFEGPKDRVSEVIRWCSDEQPHAEVQNVEVFEEEYQGNFDSFRIKHI